MASCRAGIVEQNTFRNVRSGGPYSGKRSTAAIIVRDNYFRNVIEGIVWVPDNTGPLDDLLSLARDGTSALATVSINSSFNHRLAVGDRVFIQVSSPSDFTGYYTI